MRCAEFSGNFLSSPKFSRGIIVDCRTPRIGSRKVPVSRALLHGKKEEWMKVSHVLAALAAIVVAAPTMANADTFGFRVGSDRDYRSDYRDRDYRDHRDRDYRDYRHRDYRSDRDRDYRDRFDFSERRDRDRRDYGDRDWRGARAEFSEDRGRHRGWYHHDRGLHRG